MSDRFAQRTRPQVPVAQSLSTAGANVNNGTPWVRPSDWQALPTLSTSDQKFVGLIAVWPTGANAVAVLADTSTGTYTVNWGDGTTDSSVTKNTAKNHQYTYSTLSGSPTTEGFKTAIVTITPDTGNFTKIDLQQRPTVYTNPVETDPGWLDIAIAGSSITTLRINTSNDIGNYTLLLYALRQVHIVSCALTSFAFLFANCSNLKSVKIGTTGILTSTEWMFSSCFNLESVSLFDTSSVTNMSGMFEYCEALKVVPLFNTQSVTTMYAMFSKCRSLRSVPLFNTASVVNMDYMFLDCSSLRSVPLFNTASVTSMYAMFWSCYALETVPLFNTASVTQMGAMFQECHALQSVPSFNIASVTDMSNMFAYCYSLRSVPSWNTVSVTNMGSMFVYCWSLETIPFFDTSSVLSMVAMFNNCLSLKYVPSLISRGADISYIFGAVNYNLASAALLGTRSSIDYSNCLLSSSELNAIYTNLADIKAYTVTNASWSSGVVTYTIGTHYMVVGQFVTISGASPSYYNVTDAVVTAVTSTTFSIANASSGGGWMSGGSIAANSNQTITVTNNFGTSGDTPSIATNKGWTVTG